MINKGTPLIYDKFGKRWTRKRSLTVKPLNYASVQVQIVETGAKTGWMVGWLYFMRGQFRPRQIRLILGAVSGAFVLKIERKLYSRV